MKYILILALTCTFLAQAQGADMRSYVSEDGLSETFVVSERENGFMGAMKARRRARSIALMSCEQSGWEKCEVESRTSGCRDREVLFMSMRICDARVTVIGTHDND